MLRSRIHQPAQRIIRLAHRTGVSLGQLHRLAEKHRILLINTYTGKF